MKLKLDRVGWTVDGTRLVSFRDVNLTSFNIRISDKGRLLSVGWGHRTLHSRKQRGKGGHRYRLPAAKARRAKEIAQMVEAFLAFDGEIERFPVQEFDL